MSPTLNGNSVILHFECSDVIEIHSGTIFRFLHKTDMCIYSCAWLTVYSISTAGFSGSIDMDYMKEQTNL